MNEPEPVGTVPGTSRRRLVGAMGAGAVAAWAAPAIVSGTPASAGTISTCAACAGGNIVINGDASSGTTGWTSTVGTLVDVDLLGIHLFAGLTTILGTTVTATQTIDVSACAAIATGGVTLDVSAVGGSLLGTLSATLAIYLDSPVLPAFTQTVSGALSPITGTAVAIPASTTTITVELTFLSALPLLGAIGAGIDDIVVTLNCAVQP